MKKITLEQFITERQENDCLSKADFVKLIHSKYGLAKPTIYQKYKEMYELIPEVFCQDPKIDLPNFEKEAKEKRRRVLINALKSGKSVKEVAELYNETVNHVSYIKGKYKILRKEKPIHKDSLLTYVCEGGRDNSRSRLVICECRCGRFTRVRMSHITRERGTISCGCQMLTGLSQKIAKHKYGNDTAGYEDLMKEDRKNPNTNGKVTY